MKTNTILGCLQLLFAFGLASCYRSAPVESDTEFLIGTDSETNHGNGTDSVPEVSLFPYGWQPPFYMKASNSYSQYYYGNSVSISNETVVVGAYGEDFGFVDVSVSYEWRFPDAGAVYVIGKENEVWTEQAYVKASNAEQGDYFGYAVAIDGDTLVVGAPEEDGLSVGVNGDMANNHGMGVGAAYVFARSKGEWFQQAYLKASNAASGDRFGWSVDVDGDRIVVSAIGEAGSGKGVNGDEKLNDAPNAGAVYVFVRQGDSWSQEAYLKASNTNEADYFGYAVSLSGNTLAVGAHGEQGSAKGVNGEERNNELGGAGAVYIFDVDTGHWQQQAYIKASNVDGEDGFGSTLDLDNDVMVVGAQQEDSNSRQINGDENNNDARYAGAAYVFKRSDDGIGVQWKQTAYLKASNTDEYDLFGCHVAIDGNIILVGAYGESSGAMGIDGDMVDNSSYESGAVYLFERVAGQWNEQAYIKSSNSSREDRFGVGFDLSGSVFVIGAEGEDSPERGVGIEPSAAASRPASGAAYLYEFSR